MRVIVSENGAAYRRLTVTSRFCSYGTLAAPMPLGTEIDPDAEVLVNVPEAMIDRTWPSASESGWWLGNVLAWIGREIVSVREVEVVSAQQVKLKGIIRRRFGPVYEAHGVGAEVFVIRRVNVVGASIASVAADDSVNFKVMSGTRWGYLAASEVAAQPITVLNATARPMGANNLLVNGDWSPPFQWAPGGDVVIRWRARHPNRNALWPSFNDPYRPSGMESRVAVFNDVGVRVWFSVVRDAARIEEDDGHFKLTIANSALVTMFGGTEPERFSIRLFQKTRGLLSMEYITARIRRSDTAHQSNGHGLLFWQPSGLHRLHGCTNPEPLLQYNFTACATHFAATLPWPTITGLESRTARTHSRANFAALATATGLTMEDVLTGPGRVAADLQCDRNFELLNAAW
jgi:hypothetical protein